MKPPPPLVALTPGDLTERSAAGFAARAEAALEAGLRGVLLREPGLAERPFLALALRLRERCDAWGAWLGVHDRAHVAALARADGLHLGFRSLAPADLPAALHEGRAVGLSSHAGDELDREGVDYLFHGPVRATPSKAGLRGPLGFEALARAVDAARVPVWGIGGLQPVDAGGLARSGAAGMAVLRGVFGARDAAAAAAAYLEALRAAGL